MVCHRRCYNAVECRAGRRANTCRSTLSSGNGTVLAFKRRRFRQIVRMGLKSGKDVGMMGASEAANGESRMKTRNVWNTVRIDLSTHEVGGLSNIDVEPAKKINALV